MKRHVTTFAVAAFVALALAGIAWAQTSKMPVPSGVGAVGQVLTFTDSNNVQGAHKIQSLTATVTQFTLAAQTCVEKAYSVSGLTTSDRVTVNPAYTTAVEALMGNARAAAADSLEVTFCNPHAAAVDPETGTLNVLAIRS